MEARKAKHVARTVKQPNPHVTILTGLTAPASYRSMQYSIFTSSTGEPLDTVDMHVLARAYRAAWRSHFAQDPAGPHALRELDVLFVFMRKDPDPGREP
jgi:hypothetical protein